MAVTKMTGNVNVIQALSDKPNQTDGLTAAQMKAKYDEAAGLLKTYINNTLTDELDSNFALKQELIDLTLGEVPDNSIVNNKLANDIKVGSLANLNTTDKTSVVNAINEVATDADTDITRSKGFNLDLPYYYSRNTKLIDLCTNANYVSGAGTQSQDTSNVKVGSEALKVLENDNTGSKLYSTRSSLSLNLATFNDASTSATTDYIYLSVYVSDHTKVSNIEVTFKTDGSNYFTYTKTTDITTGYNFIAISKSAFTSTLSPSWATITVIEVAWTSTATAQNAYITFNYIGLMRKDPSTSAPNPFQRELNSVWTRDMAINAGAWYVGLESNELICRNLDTVSDEVASAQLTGTKAYTDFIAHLKLKMNNTTVSSTLLYKVDASNYIKAYIRYGNVLTLRIAIAGAEVIQTVAISTTTNDVWDIKLKRVGSNVYLEGVKNNNTNTIYALSGTFTPTTNGYIGLTYITPGTIPSNIQSLSVTITEHSHHCDITELAKDIKSDNAKAAYKNIARNSSNNNFTYQDSMQSLLTAQGDIIYASGSNTPAKLAKAASDGAILYQSSNIPAWLPKGTDGQVLTLASGLPSWAGVYARFVEGTYTGNGAKARTINIGATPKFIIISDGAQGSSGYATGFGMTGNPANVGFYNNVVNRFSAGTASNPASDIPYITTNGFIVGSDASGNYLNVNARTYYYFAIY